MQKKHLILAILVTLVWGVNFPITKLGLLSMEPFLLTGIRFTLAALPLVFFIPRPNISFRYVVIYGFIFGLGMWGIINYGIEVGVHPGVASLLIQLSAFFTMGWGALLFKERLRATQWLGAVIAFVGLVGILLSQGGGDATFGLVLVVLSAVSWSIGNVIIKLSGVKEIFSFMVWASLFPPIPLFIVSYWLHGAEPFTTLPEAINLMSVMSILFQVYLATHFSYWGWNSLLKLYPVSTVAPLSLLIPVFGLGSSMLILGEQVSFVEALSISAIIAGLAFGLYKGPGRPVSYPATR
ncbi:EamA family transporter [Alcaligenes aquatilis]|uniref:EamA family transporter n=1 Tax=Alcaligenes aquatilis TaxID=323284 RepID=UPI003F93A632